jgi:hypothetical protein
MVSQEAAPRVDASPDPMPGMNHHASMPNSSPADDQMGMSTPMEHASNGMPSHDGNGPGRHSHEMSEGMLKIEREHFWFTVVGLAVALFKFISDNGIWRRAFVLHLWPSFVTLLGVLLVLYTE